MTGSVPGQELKPEQALALQLLRLRFPEVPIWYGHATGHWWALVGDQRLEAGTPEDLGRRIDGIHALRPCRRMAPRHARPFPD
jgi:hypothetical protein